MRVRASVVVTSPLLLTVFMSAGPGDRSTAGTGTVVGVVRSGDGTPLQGARITARPSGRLAFSLSDGWYRLDSVPEGPVTLRVMRLGYALDSATVTVRADSVVTVDFTLAASPFTLNEIVTTAGNPPGPVRIRVRGSNSLSPGKPDGFTTEEYRRIVDNRWQMPARHPRSTFSIDVDAASYTNVRRFIHEHRLPPPDAVRIEEMINYFPYAYPEPRGEAPFSVTTELADAPWYPAHKLLRIGLQGRRIPREALPPNNLVFLLDVSGSMVSPDKLPLVKAAFRLLVGQLRPEDRVAIVVYAGAAGLVLPSTPGDHREQILDAIERLEAGGSTAGGAGIALAYRTAREQRLAHGNNRVILATDGDFNVGISSEGDLLRLIERERETGIFLTVLGFGTGNLKDAKMEQLADHGNGHFAYVDDLLEAKKVFVREMGATLLTIAKDVKLQVEFNPRRVAAYRLIGYENRLLADEDFNDDAKDAGDMGAGHAVTALYEIVPTGGPIDVPLGAVDPLRYQRETSSPRGGDDWATIALRYKRPTGTKSQRLEQVVTEATPAPSADFRFASAVAGVGMLLRDSEFKGEATYPAMTSLARSAVGADPQGYRAEFVRLVEAMELLAAQRETLGRREEKRR